MRCGHRLRCHSFALFSLASSVEVYVSPVTVAVKFSYSWLEQVDRTLRWCRGPRLSRRELSRRRCAILSNAKRNSSDRGRILRIKGEVPVVQSNILIVYYSVPLGSFPLVSPGGVSSLGFNSRGTSPAEHRIGLRSIAYTRSAGCIPVLTLLHLWLIL